MLSKNINLNYNILNNMLQIVNTPTDKGVKWKKKLNTKVVRKTNKNKSVKEYLTYSIQIDKPLQDYLNLSNNELIIAKLKNGDIVLSNTIPADTERVYHKSIYNTFKRSVSATLFLPKAIIPANAEYATIYLDMFKDTVFLSFS